MLMLLCVEGLLAQADFRKGYVVTYANDTLYGEIDYRGNRAMGRICVFRTPAGDEVEYTPYDIVAYRFVDSKYYVSKQVEQRKLFLEMLVQGELNVYFYKDADGEHYYLEKADMPLSEIPFEKQEIVQEGYVYTRSNRHYGMLTLYTQDAPALQPDIKRIKELSPRNMVTLAQKYHDAVCDDYTCIVYEKQLPKVRVDVELAGGTFNIMSNDLLGQYRGAWALQTGAYAHVWLPRDNERLFFRTGLVSNVFPNMTQKGNLLLDEGNSLIKIPVSFEYQYSKGVFRPRASYGLNYYVPNMLTVGVMLGANFYVGKHVALSVNYELETLPAPYLLFLPTFRFWGQSIYAGVYVCF